MLKLQKFKRNNKNKKIVLKNRNRKTIKNKFSIKNNNKITLPIKYMKQKISLKKISEIYLVII